MSLKDLARAYYSAVNAYDAEAIERMVDEGYIQHNPRVPTGRAAFVGFLPRLREAGSKIHNVRMLEDGQHVIMHHRWENAQPFGHARSAAFHIIRFDSNSKIAEHWNVMVADPRGSHTDGSTDIEDLERTESNRAQVAEFIATLIRMSGRSVDDWRYRKLHRVFAEGNFALAVSEADHHGAATAVYDLFRLEAGRIAEHWRIAQPIPSENLANDNTMFGF